jgi:hypothetical protein
MLIIYVFIRKFQAGYEGRQLAKFDHCIEQYRNKKLARPTKNDLTISKTYDFLIISGSEIGSAPIISTIPIFAVTIQLATLIFSKKVLDRFLGEIFIFPASLPPAHFSHHEASSWAHGAS